MVADHHYARPANKVLAATHGRMPVMSPTVGYQFISDNAKGASRKFGEKSVSQVAIKT